jgi:ribonuclease G
MCKLPTAHHPSKNLGELNRASSILETFLMILYSIQIDDEELYKQRITCKKLHHPNNQ